jgi:hypothetical protein
MNFSVRFEDFFKGASFVDKCIIVKIFNISALGLLIMLSMCKLRLCFRQD